MMSMTDCRESRIWGCKKLQYFPIIVLNGSHKSIVFNAVFSFLAFFQFSVLGNADA